MCTSNSLCFCDILLIFLGIDTSGYVHNTLATLEGTDSTGGVESGLTSMGTIQLTLQDVHNFMAEFSGMIIKQLEGLQYLCLHL